MDSVKKYQITNITMFQSCNEIVCCDLLLEKRFIKAITKQLLQNFCVMNINVLMFKNMFGDQKIYIPRGESSVN